MFRSADKDNNGSLDVYELRDMLRKGKSNMTDSQIAVSLSDNSDVLCTSLQRLQTELATNACINFHFSPIILFFKVFFFLMFSLSFHGRT